ncbi:N-acetyltransferase domain-containing protein [Fusarium keratoplasticum]|uniref:N-acetyltransferase domain-containing protein n=1 Tax=Fusarium keratoplasticum TaxID=1328300 RepID=A0ACC0QJC5_9HYPO|nr:N-acetyltransferase domain-containing protein [Fusarium keratoplasticum]KAI8657132.1 N-acetyltransferase domain-containing protein [Fusarium keratoplasticum]KAI8658109.1 N-acetyltransferase domain-containing protein [Fusarium keratoplasticum]
MSYHFIHVDRSATDLSSVADKYRALRLEALQQSPTSFSSTWDIESRFSNDTWVSRLRNSGKETFACVYQEGQTSVWVAQVNLRGPLSVEDFGLPSQSGQSPPLDEMQDEKWQMLSLYTSVSHRGKGLGAKLCREAFQFIQNRLGNESRSATVRIMVKPENTVTVGLYQRLGFAKVGLCTLEEALRANGDADLIPTGKLEEKYTTRSGIIMVLCLRKSHAIESGF